MRVYLTVAVLWFVVTAPYAWSAGGEFLSLCGVDVSARWTGAAFVSSLSILCTTAVVAWLHILTRGRPNTDPSTAVRTVLTGAALFGLYLAPLLLGGSAVAAVVSRLAHLGLLVWLVVSLCRRHGLSPQDWGLWPRPARDLWSGKSAKTMSLALEACVLAAPLALLFSMLPGPVQQVDQTTVEGYGPGLFFGHMLWSSVVEEVVTTGAVAALLSTVRRPVGEIALVVGVMRAIPHLYFGLPALAMLALGAACTVLYLRHRRPLPLAAGHFAYNLLTLLPFILAAGLAGLVLVLLGRVEKRTAPGAKGPAGTAMRTRPDGHARGPAS
ncbi:CPBP family glutamic-type intramembrane protease [Streptomyces sp. B8F3]|uniref:CPBP family glutamic-type intramembrane protease n=1 Tax=Streptomyces sp. B8F3 TaxID=3153573 RepID=UPI00325EE123